jgi:hypothetical protein
LPIVSGIDPRSGGPLIPFKLCQYHKHFNNNSILY